MLVGRMGNEESFRMPTQVMTIRDSLVSGFTKFINFIPTLLGALIVLAIGWGISNVVARFIHRVAGAVKFEAAVERIGFRRLFPAAQGVSFSGILATLGKWFIRLVFIQAAANLLNMPQVTAIINSIILFIPNVVVALLILVGGSMAARFLGDLVSTSVAKTGVARPQLFRLITQYAVLGFAFIAAVHQLGIVTSLINILFTGLIASLSIAIGLAFGLGGQGVAAEITRSWYEQGKVSPERLKTVSGATKPGAGGAA